MTPGGVLFSLRYYAHNLGNLPQIDAVYVFTPQMLSVTVTAI